MLKSKTKLAKARLALVAAVLALGGVWLVAGGSPDNQKQRDLWTKTFQAGNFKDAFEGLKKLCLDPKNDPMQVGKDLQLAVDALRRLGRIDEADDFRESVIKVHAKNWRLLAAAADSYANQPDHHGFIVAGKFHRGTKRGGARYVNTMLRDRARALQLLDEAHQLMANENDKLAAAGFYMQFARHLMYAGNHEPWRLQYLTDLSKLPDYEEGYIYRRGFGGNHTGAPVDADGNPVYHHLPKSYETAASDGQRWRWALMHATELDPNRLNEADLWFANFYKQELGVQTMAQFGFRFPRGEEQDQDQKTGTYALHTLKDTETIARLATGIKRFAIPDEFNYIKVFERIIARGRSSQAEGSYGNLAQEFEDRRQYVRAADMWKKFIDTYGAGANGYRQQRLDQIVKNWGRFEPNNMQAAGTKANVEYRFRNGNKVSFEAHAIKVGKLLDDVKAYLKANPGRIDYSQIQIGNIGHRLVELNQNQYLGEKVATWDLDVKPRPGHVDARVTVTTPMSKAGAYLVSATMAGGNVSRIIIWNTDTIILKKQLDGQVFYYVADAATGTPVSGAQLDFFGWKQEQVKPNVNQFRVDTLQFNTTADNDGQVITGAAQQPNRYQWLITAKAARNSQEDRFAYLGFTGVWYSRRYDPEYNQTKVFTITDRPVYRPEQTANFKMWIEHAKYDEPNTSAFAGKTFIVRIHSPKAEKVYEKSLTADEYGGISGEYLIPKSATLGVYGVQVLQNPNQPIGRASFRVEEYKKPEFEVTVEAPKEPVRLGEKIEATIHAKYYFGAPVVNAKVKYKIMRQEHTARWYPRGDWDWMYGRGYWWFSPDFPWYPGFHDWGCFRPMPWWWHRQPERPEMIAEQEVDIGPDGIVKVEIDTAVAKELHGNQDHKYSITAEVTDQSRRTIVGAGDVLVARKPFQVHAWLNRGHFRAGDTVIAYFNAQTLDQKPVEGKGELTLYAISYDDKNQPVEKAVETWKLDTDVEGKARQQVKAAKAGQYRLSYKVTDAKKHTIEGGYLFMVRGDAFTGRNFRFNDIEIVADKREYQPGDKVKLMINTDQDNGTILLFARPSGVYQKPQVIRLDGKSTEQELDIVQRDMPNIFVEAVTIHGGRVHSEMREIIVPPEKRVLNVAVEPSQQEYKPGQKATVKVQLTDWSGKPFIGSTVVSIYDKSVEYISGGSNVPEIKEFFWKWRRHHSPQTESSLVHYFHQLLRRNEIGMANLGIFGEMVIEEMEMAKGMPQEGLLGGFSGRGGGLGENRREFAAQRAMAPAAGPMAAADGMAKNGAGLRQDRNADFEQQAKQGGDPGAGPEPTVRKNFADTAYWNASLTTDKNGRAEVNLTMPEQLTGWKVRVWALGHGTKVGQGEALVTTKKDLIVRLQAPRFFTQKDEVVLSANVHNYLKGDKKVRVHLEMDGGTLAAQDPLIREINIKAGGEQRVDWRVKVVNEGEAIVRMKAISDDDSDAMEMRFPCYVHGMLKMESFTGVIRPDKDMSSAVFTVPSERRIEQSRLEVRYSPTLAGAMVDALPYMVDYPYGCTEQTLNRFLPTVITQRILQRMNIDLKEVEKHQVNLNAAEIGDDKERIKQWKRFKRNPVFNEAEVKEMVNAGIAALASMQLSDGGWGWFSGYGERSWPHTTAVVVHGLQIAQQNDVAVPAQMITRGLDWLKNYQDQETLKLRNFPTRTFPWKEHAGNMDAFAYMVLVDSKIDNQEMRGYLYRDRNHLSVYAKAQFGLALHKQQDQEKLAMILRNIEQFVVQDAENQTAYLRLPPDTPWWHWWGAEIEADAYYLKLLAATSPRDEKAAGLVKYLLNNRKHSTYWNSTRDTALCIEAMADYLKASGEDRPDMTVEVWLDGKKHKEVQINQQNLFTFDNKLVLEGDRISAGKHTLEIKRRGSGPVYWNAYQTNFTLEDFITKAGLEVKVNRKYYRLDRVDEKIKTSGAKGQVLDQKIDKYKRTELENLATVKSGDLIEIELEIDSKNDYEYLIFEDPKAAGFESVAVRSGYTYTGMGAYMEVRDEKIAFFARVLPRGKHSISYRMRAEIPGQFSALPTRAYAMYAPELKGNSDEIKIRVQD
ncbi:MAG: MG2 domain-containing protein [Gemmataceae bacterium]|nr:MG2 domain-containing protein [Gemmataceae bacterium]